jgi:hypothetical protein
MFPALPMEQTNQRSVLRPSPTMKRKLDVHWLVCLERESELELEKCCLPSSRSPPFAHPSSAWPTVASCGPGELHRRPCADSGGGERAGEPAAASLEAGEGDGHRVLHQGERGGEVGEAEAPKGERGAWSRCRPPGQRGGRPEPRVEQVSAVLGRGGRPQGGTDLGRVVVACSPGQSRTSRPSPAPTVRPCARSWRIRIRERERWARSDLHRRRSSSSGSRGVAPDPGVGTPSSRGGHHAELLWPRASLLTRAPVRVVTV